MAQHGKIKAKEGYGKIIIIVSLLVLGAIAAAYMFNHYTTEELARFALIKYIFQ